MLFDLADSFPTIDSFSFIEYAPPPLIQDRNACISHKLLEETLELRCETGLPFWDCLMSKSLSTQTDFSFVAEEALFRNSAYGKTIFIQREKLRDELPKLCSESNDSNFAMAVCSKVKLVDGSYAQIPLFDLQCRPEHCDLSIVHTTAERILDGSYYIVSSGKSFHLYFRELLDEVSWRNTMYRSLLLHPIIDTRYIAHQLLDGECKLRLTPASYKATQPVVLEFVER